MKITRELSVELGGRGEVDRRTRDEGSKRGRRRRERAGGESSTCRNQRRGSSSEQGGATRKEGHFCWLLVLLFRGWNGAWRLGLGKRCGSLLALALGWNGDRAYGDAVSPEMLLLFSSRRDNTAEGPTDACRGYLSQKSLIERVHSLLTLKQPN